MNLLTIVNNDLVIFDVAAFRLSDVIAVTKTVVPATHTSPEMYVVQISLRDVSPIIVPAEDADALDKLYANLTGLMVGEQWQN